MKVIQKKQLLSSSLLSAIFCLSVGTINSAHANAVDEAADACTEAARLIQKEDDLDAAIEEATWCLTGLKQLKDEIKLSLFPDALQGFEGGKIENESIMGISTIKRNYTRDGQKLTVSLISTGSAGGPLAGLGDLGKLIGALEGAGGGGGKKIRIQRRTVVVTDEGGKGALTVQLKSGGTLQVESRDLDSDGLVNFMREFPIAELDDAMAN